VLADGQDGSEAGAERSDGAVPDLEISLRKESVFEAVTPPAVRRNESFPGERPALLRAHPEAPPVTPHGIADFLPITREQNLCTDCHLIEDREEGLPTPIPESHFVDDRNAPNTVREEIVGSRWLCTSCHVPQTDNPPLVENRVTGVTRAPARDRGSGSP
jgi:cytochrome c-type protein NapB